MSNQLLDFPDLFGIEEEAARWLIRLDGDDEPTADELDALAEWVARSPKHGEELGKLARMWGQMNVLTDLAVPLGGVTRQKRPFFSNSRNVVFGVNRWPVFASGLLLAVMIGYIALMGSDPYAATNVLYATAVGQQQTATLVDGTVVQLNTNSQIRVEYTERSRDIHLLQGEVYFIVAKDAAKPFQVYAGNTRVKAVGTEFTVYEKGSVVEVTVVEGQVVLAALRQTTNIAEQENRTHGASGSNAIMPVDFVEVSGTLGAGQRAIIDTRIAHASANSIGIQDLIVNEVSPEDASQPSWRSGMLTFTGDPLEDVVREISRYTRVSIEISDPAVRAIKIGGRFPVGEIDVMLGALEANFGLQVTRLSDERVLVSLAE